MNTNQPLSLFISSKMTELAEERKAVQQALATYRLSGWLWEQDAGARPESVRNTYLKEVETCDIYLGLFWLGYGVYTVEEYEHARKLQKPCLIYEKHISMEHRDPQLTQFLDKITEVTATTGVTVYRFKSVEDLTGQVQKDVMHLLVTQFRESRSQPSTRSILNWRVLLTALLVLILLVVGVFASIRFLPVSTQSPIHTVSPTENPLSISTNSAIANSSPTQSTSPAPTPGGWHSILYQVAPSCASPAGFTWQPSGSGITSACQGSELAMQNTDYSSFAAMNLVQIKAKPFNLDSFRVKVTVRFEDIQDEFTSGGILVQLPSTASNVIGYLFEVYPTAGRWELLQIIKGQSQNGETNLGVGYIGSAGQHLETVTFIVEVQGGELRAYSNTSTEALLSWHLDSKPDGIGLVTYGHGSIPSKYIYFSQFELDDHA